MPHPFGDQALAAAQGLLRQLLRDRVVLHALGPKRTAGYHTTRSLEPVGEFSCLIQTIEVPAAGNNPAHQAVVVKLPWATPCKPGMVVEVIASSREPSLVGEKLTLLSVSHNGAALLRACRAVRGVQTNVEGQT